MKLSGPQPIPALFLAGVVLDKQTEQLPGLLPLPQLRTIHRTVQGPQGCGLAGFL